MCRVQEFQTQLPPFSFCYNFNEIPPTHSFIAWQAAARINIKKIFKRQESWGDGKMHRARQGLRVGRLLSDLLASPDDLGSPGVLP